jgi:hypothetical protein
MNENEVKKEENVDFIVVREEDGSITIKKDLLSINLPLSIVTLIQDLATVTVQEESAQKEK